MNYILNHTNKPYLKFFEDISAIPRESYNEAEISKYVAEFAKAKKLDYTVDSVGNVLIRKPASHGYEDHAPVSLQGHMDMVCEKEPGSKFDFSKDPLQLYVEDGWLRAKGTTLGADDGVAVAYMLALLDDESLKHPELECIFTVSEEPGVFGAKAFDVSQLRSKKMIGLDGTTEGTSTVLTSGVVGGDFRKPFTTVENKNPVYKLHVAGLNGGHGGKNMANEQANAVKCISRALYYLLKELRLNIVQINGGTIRNGIAEECTALITLDETNELRAKELFEDTIDRIKKEHKYSDPGIYCDFQKTHMTDCALDDNSTKSLVELLYLTPSGTYMRSLVYPGLPVASRNLGNIITFKEESYVQYGYLFRCTATSLLYDLLERGKLLANQFGAEFNLFCEYPGYDVAPNSPLFNVWNDVYKEATGNDVVPEAVHYGTDTGTFVERIPGLDIIVLSPVILDVHRPTERLNLDSFSRVYEYIKEILQRL